jgi:nitroreductase
MIHLLRTRRSIRKYEARPIDEQSLQILKEALLRCPSSRGTNPWTFVFVDDADLRYRLSLAKKAGSQFLKDAALDIVICGDETMSDVWVEDCSIAAILVQLTAQSLGLGSCWSQMRNREHTKERSAEEYVQELLTIPKNLRVESIISLGYPAETRPPVPADQLDYGKIRYNGYR